MGERNIFCNQSPSSGLPVDVNMACAMSQYSGILSIETLKSHTFSTGHHLLKFLNKIRKYYQTDVIKTTSNEALWPISRMQKRRCNLARRHSDVQLLSTH